jgi:hypothetical protein
LRAFTVFAAMLVPENSAVVAPAAATAVKNERLSIMRMFLGLIGHQQTGRVVSGADFHRHR